jgi:hypothetical protein
VSSPLFSQHCSGPSYSASAQQNGLGATKPYAKPQHGLHAEALWSEPESGCLRPVHAAGLCDMHSWHCGEFSPRRIPSLEVLNQPQPSALWITQSRWPALPSWPHVFLREYGAFPRAQTPPPVSRQICPDAYPVWPARVSFFPA